MTSGGRRVTQDRPAKAVATAWAPVDAVLARHRVVALERYARALWADGIELPPELVALLEACRTRSRTVPGGSPLVSGAATAPSSEPMVLLATLNEAGEALRLGSSTIKRLVASGALPTVKVGRARRVHVEDLARFADDLRRAGPRADRAVS